VLETDRSEASVVFKYRENAPKRYYISPYSVKIVLYFTLLIVVVEDAGYSALLTHTCLPIKSQRGNPRLESNKGKFLDRTLYIPHTFTSVDMLLGERVKGDVLQAMQCSRRVQPPSSRRVSSRCRRRSNGRSFALTSDPPGLGRRNPSGNSAEIGNGRGRGGDINED
jgi:hypothetical protein